MPVMSNQDFDTLFYRVEELHSLHAEFYEGLMPRLQNWSADTQIGDLFQNLVGSLPVLEFDRYGVCLPVEYTLVYFRHVFSSSKIRPSRNMNKIVITYLVHYYFTIVLMFLLLINFALRYHYHELNSTSTL